MIKNGQILRKFETALARAEGPLPPLKAFNIFSALWKEAQSLGVIPFPDPLAGIEIDIKMARIINSCLKS